MIHDVGAGGLSNAIPELLHDSGRGGAIELRDVPSAEPGLAPLEIWCNEAQERYVLAIDPAARERFAALCERERCPYAVVGVATAAAHLRVDDRLLGTPAIDIPMDLLFGKPPRMTRTAARLPVDLPAFDTSGITIAEAARRVPRSPGVGDKRFLITIATAPCARGTRPDGRTLAGAGGDCALRQPISAAPAVKPWPSANAPRSRSSTVRPRPGWPSAKPHQPRRGTHQDLADVVLSANWMAPAGYPGEDARLYDMVRALGLEFCPALGINIPVGKDSMSMQSAWSTAAGEVRTVAPVSLVISAFAPVVDVGKSLTPQLVAADDSVLVLIDLGGGQHRLGGSVFAQAWHAPGGAPPDCSEPARLAEFFGAIQALNEAGYLLAYPTAPTVACSSRSPRWRSPGAWGWTSSSRRFTPPPHGLVQRTVRFAPGASRTSTQSDAFSPETPRSDRGSTDRTHRRAARHHHPPAAPLFHAELDTLLADWSATTHAMQRLRDNPPAPTKNSRPSSIRSTRSHHRGAAAAAACIARQHCMVHGRASRSCVSKGQRPSKWPRHSTAPALPRSTCT